MENRKNETPELFFVAVRSANCKNALDEELHKYAFQLKDCLITRNTIKNIEQAHALILDGYVGRAKKPMLRIFEQTNDTLIIGGRSTIQIQLTETLTLYLIRIRKML